MIISKKHKDCFNGNSKRLFISKKASGEGAAARSVGRAAVSTTGDEGSAFPLPDNVDVDSMTPEAREWWDVMVEFNKHEEKATTAAFASGIEGLKGFCNDMDGRVGQDGAQEILDEAKQDESALPALEEQYNSDPSVFETMEEHEECISEASFKRIDSIKKKAISKRHDTYNSSNHDVIIATCKITESKMKAKGFDKKSLIQNNVVKIASNKKYYSNYSQSYTLEALKTYLELDYIKKYGSNGKDILRSDLNEFISAIGNGESTFDEVFKSSQSFKGPINIKAYMNGEYEPMLKTAGKGAKISKTAWPGWLDDSIDYVSDVAESTWDGAVELAGDVGSAVGSAVGEVYDIATEGLDTVWEGMKMAGCKLWEWIKEASAATWAFLTGGVIAIISAIMKFGAKLLPFLGLIFSVGAIIDGVYYGWRALQDDVLPLANEAGVDLSGMRVLKYNETAQEAGSKFQESLEDPTKTKILAKYTKGLRDLQHNIYQVVLNTVQAILDTVFIVLELAGLLTAGLVTAIAVCIDIFTSMVIMGIETGIKDRIATAYDNILQVAFANASTKWSNLMSGIEESATVLMTEEQMEERRRLAEQGMAQGSESESGDSLEAMLAAGLPPLQPAAATTAVSTQPSNVIPLNAAQPGPTVAPQMSGPGASLSATPIAASLKYKYIKRLGI